MSRTFPSNSFAIGAVVGASAGALATWLALRRRTPKLSTTSRIRHSVLVKLKPDTPEAAVDRMLEALAELPAKIPSIQRMEIGRQVAVVDDGRNASIGGIVEFACEADYVIKMNTD